MNLSRSKVLHLWHQSQALALLLCIIVLSAFPVRPATAQTYAAFLDAPASPSASLTYFASPDKPPPFSNKRIAGQMALGTVAGLGAGIAGGFIGVALEDCNDEDFLCGLSGALLGVTVGIIAGSSVGVYVAGRTETVEIGYGRTLLGSVAGFGAGVLLLSAIDGGDDSLAILAIFISPAVGATLLGNTSRRYRAGHGPHGLLSWDEGQLHLSVPALQQQPLGGVPQTVVRSVRLLEVRW